jgi:hypothetical protein
MQRTAAIEVQQAAVSAVRSWRLGNEFGRQFIVELRKL